MLPYWHGTAIEFCVRPPPLQPLQPLTPAAAAAAAAAATAAAAAAKAACESASEQAADRCTSDTDNTDWHWLAEDRLQLTPTEQRATDTRTTEEQSAVQSRIATIDLATFPNWCDLLSVDSLEQTVALNTCASNRDRCGGGKSPEPVGPQTLWRAEFSMGDCRCYLSTPPPPPMPPASDNFPDDWAASVDQGNNSNSGGRVASASGGQATASGRDLPEIEAAVEHTRNNSNQQQRYEMRGGHAVEICSRVEFPDRLTRDVSVTVEATHSNGCHRVIMLKGLTAKKRPDLGPKVKDCRLRMDQIVMTRPSAQAGDWQKSVTMSYDSDFQVGLGEESSRPL